MKPRLLICAFMLFCSVYSISQGNYTDINPDIVEYTAQINYYFDIDKDGTDDFYIRYDYLEGWWASMEIHPLSNTFVCVTSPNSIRVDTLNYGDIINEELSWSDSEAWMYGDNIQTWYGIDNKMIGIRKSIGNDNYYGWFRLELTTWMRLTIYDFSYNSIANAPVFAGNDVKYVATEMNVADTSNNLNGTDLFVSANQALFWEDMLEYRFIAVKAENAATFDLEQASQLNPDRYMVIPNYSEISTTFLSDSKDADGDLIGADSYVIFILSQISADSSVLSNPSGIVSLFLEPDAVTGILGIDIGDYGDGRDLQINFENIEDETTISEYRVFVVPYIYAGWFSLEMANDLTVDKYTSVVPIGDPIQVQLTENSLNTIGGYIGSGGYRIFIMSVASDVQTSMNTLSETSPVVGLRKLGDNMILCGDVASDMQFVDFDPDIHAHVTPGANAYRYLDLNQDGINDFMFHLSYYTGTNFTFIDNVLTNFNGTENKVRLGPLDEFVPIEINSPGWNYEWTNTLAHVGPTYSGPWLGNADPKYMGFKFCTEEDTTFYWLKMQATYDEITLYEYAFLNFNAVGLSEQTAEIRVQPNPVADYFQIKTDFPERIKTFTIYNLQGIKLVGSNYTQDNVRIDFSKFLSGVYILEISFVDKRSSFLKIIKK